MEICCKDVPHSINYNVRERGALPRRAGTTAEQLRGSYRAASTNQGLQGSHWEESLILCCYPLFTSMCSESQNPWLTSMAPLLLEAFSMNLHYPYRNPRRWVVLFFLVGQMRKQRHREAINTPRITKLVSGQDSIWPGNLNSEPNSTVVPGPLGAGEKSLKRRCSAVTRGSPWWESFSVFLPWIFFKFFFYL